MTKSKKNIEDIPLPHGEAFKEAWADWLEDRAERKIPVTYNAAKRQLKLLGSTTEELAILMIDKAINNRWRGIFPLKDWDIPAKPNIYV